MEDRRKTIRILWVTRDHLNSDRPNAQCVKAVFQAMQSKTDAMLLVASNRLDDSKVEKKWYEDLKNTIRRVFYWPSTEPTLISKRIRDAEMILEGETPDYIIAVHKPYETLYASFQLKKKYPEAKLLIYEIDPIANEIDASVGLRKYLFFLTRYAERKMYSSADHIFHMRCNEIQYNSSRYIGYKKKASYLDFPMICNMGVEKSDARYYNGQTLKIVYAGGIDRTYRSPEYTLELLSEISKVLPLDVCLYARGNCVNMVREAEKKCCAIHLFDYIPKKELDAVQENCDFLINIANKYSNMLPSKLLTYINTGKPIIHISNQDSDACVTYLERYKNAIIILEKDSIESNIQKTIEFLTHHYGKRVASEEICKGFSENTAEFSARAILSYIDSEMRRG